MAILPGAFPDNVSSEVKAFLEKYFQLSNAASSHNDHEANEQAFAELFSNDGMYEFAEEQNVGRDAIISFRKKLFASVPHREHPVVRIFTFGSDDMNLMCYGTVGYRLSDDTVNMQEWAARYEIVKTEPGDLKFKYVQIIVSPARDS
ncbi:putative fungal specific transcription protein [Botrytis fragariae]|uniref:Putative fungal specific transcription protein n=1 Tax=Botrytis fragariae TaxID=1964551 RepID=A0A8H6B4E8_9HELO|nr:putative fungal specific transcription protein [Botrytis fragariae]KAF5878812.1 putative fungal specific transcription protein [Botrytis fragariae]